MSVQEIIKVTEPIMDRIIAEFNGCQNGKCVSCEKSGECQTIAKAETLVEVYRAILNNERKETDK